MSAALVHVAPLFVAATHPALPGHFPGRPIVPGVVVLDAVLQAARDWLDRPLELQSLPQAKFIAPLLPEQQATIELKLQDTELRFAVMRDSQTIAQGLMQIVVGTAP